MRFLSKLKIQALNITVDLTLKGISNSPKRCARNLSELYINSLSNKLSNDEKGEIYKLFLKLCAVNDIVQIKNEFSKL